MIDRNYSFSSHRMHWFSSFVPILRQHVVVFSLMWVDLTSRCCCYCCYCCYCCCRCWYCCHYHYRY